MSSAVDVVRALRFDPNPSRAGVVLEEYLSAFSGSAPAHVPSATDTVRAIREDLPERAALTFADFVAGTINGGGTSSMSSTAIAAMVKHDPHYDRIGLQLAAYVATQTGANAGGGGGSDPAWLPAGAVAYADAIGGHYFASGAECTITDVLAVDGENSGTTADGFFGANITALGGLYDALASLSGWTCVFEWTNNSTLDPGGNGLQIVSGNAFSVRTSDTAYVADNNGPDSVTSSALSDNAVHRLAATLGATTYSLAADGSLVGTGTLGDPYPTASISDIHISCGGYLRSITVYAPVADADLPALSALS